LLLLDGMTSSARCGWITALASLALAAGLAACGSDDSGALYDHGPVHACTGTFLCPTTAYTGYDPGHTYKTPFSTSLKDVTWSLDDPTIGEIYTVDAPLSYKDFGSSWAMVKTFKSGTTTVHAKSGSQDLTATLIVSEYDTAIVEAGRNRYYTPDNPGGQRIACSDCHTAVNGADHSPLEMEVFTDDDILSAVINGKYASDGYVLKNVDHRWNLTDAEKAGIVPYLRSLQPKGFF
jgi:hypothetical protein